MTPVVPPDPANPAVAAITTAALATASEYLDKVLDSPVKELSGFLADKVNYWRFKNRVNTVLKAKKFLEDRGIDPLKALPETLLPLIEAAGDTADENLSDMFAGLLASHLSPHSAGKVHASYAKVVSQLAPLDAAILRDIYVSIRRDNANYRLKMLPIGDSLQAEHASAEQLLLSYQNLWRLGICDRGSVLDEMNKTKVIVFTDYGWSLMSASHLD